MENKMTSSEWEVSKAGHCSPADFWLFYNLYIADRVNIVISSREKWLVFLLLLLFLILFYFFGCWFYQEMSLASLIGGLYHPGSKTPRKVVKREEQEREAAVYWL